MLSNLQPGQGLGGSGSQLLGLGGGWVGQLRRIIYGAACIFSAHGQAAVFNLISIATPFVMLGREIFWGKGALAKVATFALRARAAVFNLVGRA